MLLFIVFAILLSLLAAAFVLLPVVRIPTGGQGRQDQNVDVYEERLAELEQEYLPGEELEALRVELQRQLLHDTAAEAPAMATGVKTRQRWLIVAAILVPVFAFVTYSDLGLSLGAASDVLVAEKISRLDFANEGALASLADSLAESLARQPGNDQGWFLLGQSYLRLGRFADAQAVFERLLAQFPGDAGLLALRAEATYLAAARRYTPVVKAAVDAALAADPANVAMLEIRGMAAYQAGNLQQARDDFALALQHASGERAAVIREVLARLDNGPVTPPAVAAAAGVAIDVEVSLASGIEVNADQTLFVFARAVDGPPMPLAIHRGSVSELPLKVRLDESMAMMPQMSLANFPQVEIVARISSSGIARASADDYEVVSAGIATASVNAPVVLVITEQRGAGS